MRQCNISVTLYHVFYRYYYQVRDVVKWYFKLVTYLPVAQAQIVSSIKLYTNESRQLLTKYAADSVESGYSVFLNTGLDTSGLSQHYVIKHECCWHKPIYQNITLIGRNTDGSACV